MLNFVLCDDNIQVLNRLSKVLESIFIKNNLDAEIGFSTSNPHELLEYTESHSVNVLILDINLKCEITGCDIADIIRKKNKNVYIIFLTGHLEYALVAYKYKTFDYLPKPIIDERLEETVLRLVDDIKQDTAKFIQIDNKTMIKQDEINYIKKDGMKLVFCTSKHNYSIYSSFSKIESCLPDNFVRCHKSYIANTNNISDFKPNENIVLFNNNESCSLGAKYKNNFMEVLKNGNFSNNLECINYRG